MQPTQCKRAETAVRRVMWSAVGGERQGGENIGWCWTGDKMDREAEDDNNRGKRLAGVGGPAVGGTGTKGPALHPPGCELNGSDSLHGRHGAVAKLRK